MSKFGESPLYDGRQSVTALAVARGSQRLLTALGRTCVSELALPSGRRADLVALADDGEIWIVEIKSSIADFRADQKWQDYRMHPATRKTMLLLFARAAARRLQVLADPHGPHASEL